MELKIDSDIEVEAVRRAISWYGNATNKRATLRIESSGTVVEFVEEPTETDLRTFDQLVLDFHLRFQIDQESLNLRKSVIRSALKNCYQADK